METQTKARGEGRWLGTFPRGPVVAAVVLVALSATAFLAWRLRIELVLLFASVLFATSLYWSSGWLARTTGLGRRSATAVWYLVGFTVAGLVAWGSWQRVSAQYGSFSERIPDAIEEVESRIRGKPLVGSLANELRDLRVNMVQNGDGRGAQVSEEAGDEQSEERQVQFVKVTMRTLTGVVIWLVLTFYLALDGDRYVRMGLRAVPPDRRPIAEEVMETLGEALPWWLVGRLASMGAVAVFTGLGLFALGIPVAFTLALIAGIFSFVPLLGPIASVFPAILVTLDAAPDKLLWVVLIYWVAQLLEGYVITPRIQKETVSVLPVHVVTAQLLVGALMGIVGIMFATPLALAAIVVVQIAWLKHGLGEEIIPPQPAT